jgi:hypothetical protein
MSAFLLVIDTSSTSGPPRPMIRDDYEDVEAPFGHLFLYGPSTTLIRRDDRQLLAHHGEWLSRQEFASLEGLGPAPDAGWKDHRGTVIRIDAQGRAAHIATDLVGSFPVYYGLDDAGTRFVAGSHFAEVRAQTGRTADAIGCYEFLTNGFCVGDRTLAEGIRQLTLRETLSISVTGGSTIEHSTQVHPVLWASKSTADRKQTHETLTDIWRAETALLGQTQLMMSAGWDSRALLAGITANDLQASVFAYSHGDMQSRELRIAGKLCQAVGVTHVKTPLAEEVFRPDAADRVLAETDTYMFPFWWHAAAVGRDAHGATKFTGGLYGAVLGGHNNVPDKGSSTVRLRALARYLAGGRHPANGDAEKTFAAAERLIRPTTYHWQWCFRDEVHQQQAPWMLEAVQADVAGVLEGYVSHGVDTVENLVEAFEVDHRLRQYMNGQMITGTSHLRARNPFTNPDLLRLTTAQPLSARVHNILHQAIIRRLAPKLLRYPMGATLISARAPIAVQEMTRMQRVLLERTAGLANRWSRGIVPRPRLGWNAFQFLKDHQPFHDIVETLELDIWDRNRMHRVLRDVTGNVHPVFDMIAKCKTVDFRLTASRSADDAVVGSPVVNDRAQ